MRGGHQMAARGGAGERRRTRSLDERKRIVEEALAPGISVAAVARRHGLNTNLIFKWIRRSREGWRDRRREPAKEKPVVAALPGRGGSAFVPVKLLELDAASAPPPSDVAAKTLTSAIWRPRSSLAASPRRRSNALDRAYASSHANASKTPAPPSSRKLRARPTFTPQLCSPSPRLKSTTTRKPRATIRGLTATTTTDRTRRARKRVKSLARFRRGRGAHNTPTQERATRKT